MSVTVASAPPLSLSLPLELMQLPLLRMPSANLGQSKSFAAEKKTVVLRKQDALAVTFAECAHGHRGVQVSAAQAAATRVSGLLVGDLVLQVNGQSVNTPAEASSMIQSSATSVRMLVAGGTRRILLGRHEAKIGVKAEDRTDGPGVRIITVEKNSAAEREGLAAGDIILAVDGTLAMTHSQAILGLVRTHLDSRPHEDIDLTVALQTEAPLS